MAMLQERDWEFEAQVRTKDGEIGELRRELEVSDPLHTCGMP